MVTGSSVNARTVRLSAPSCSAPARALPGIQCSPCSAIKAKHLVAKRRAGQVVAKAATEEKPDVAKVGDHPFRSLDAVRSTSHCYDCDAAAIDFVGTVSAGYNISESTSQHIWKLTGTDTVQVYTGGVHLTTIVVFAVCRQHWSANR